jgi:hypothetical protein
MARDVSARRRRETRGAGEGDGDGDDDDGCRMDVERCGDDGVGGGVVRISGRTRGGSSVETGGGVVVVRVRACIDLCGGKVVSGRTFWKRCRR